MNNHVTLADAELSKVNAAADSVTRRREQTRERVARLRAVKKQTASIEFVRTDAGLFLHPDRLSQKAGAPKAQLRRMAIKELVDNALDAADNAVLTEVDPDTFVIEDDGPGIPPERVVALFSVTRPMMSTKLIRSPMRGAVGNGLRVATGAAFASSGSITVESLGHRQALDFERCSGETIVMSSEPSDVTAGTKITITFGAALPRDRYATAWAHTAIALKGRAAEPMLTHPDWYSDAAFAEVIQAARGSAADLAALFGVDLRNALATKIDPAQPHAKQRYIDPNGPAETLTLEVLRATAPKAPRLIPIPDDSFPGAHRVEKMVAIVSGGAVPVLVQAWAVETGTKPGASVNLIINRTPTVADIVLYPGSESLLRGCGMFHYFGNIPKGSYNVVIAITTPAIALISDGKTPDLSPFIDGIVASVSAAMKRAHQPKTRGMSIKHAAYEIMAEAYLRASADGTLPANARQIMYAARPHILAATGAEKLNDAYFTQTLLPSFIEENPELTADWDVVYDARGHFVEPHSGDTIPLGTVQVRQYLNRRRTDESLFSVAAGLHQTVGPGDRYDAVMFIEKEGFEPLLRAAQIAERFDIAIMSTKGMSVVAARSLVDRLSASGVKILVAHDLDISGIRIFGTLGSDSARYQFATPPNVKRLGLTLRQAAAMRLQSEHQAIKGDHERTLDGLRIHGATEDEIEFIAGGERIELNAMPSDIFVRWLETELRAHGVGKVIPPAHILEQRARRIVGLRHVQSRIAEIEEAARRYGSAADLPSDLAERVAHEFSIDGTLAWEDALTRALSTRVGQ